MKTGAKSQAMAFKSDSKKKKPFVQEGELLRKGGGGGN